MNELTASNQNQDFFLKNLRFKTAASHQNLEENYFSKAILDPSLTLENYRTYIAKLYGVVAACEKDVYPVLVSVLPDLNQRYKSNFITDDLKSTGVDDQLALELPVYQFYISNIPEALGIMYVLEGSTLGGRVLYKHVNQFLGLDLSNGASYFWGYGQSTGVLWKTFISVLSNYAVENNCEDEIISSATDTFTAIDHWLNKAEINW